MKRLVSIGRLSASEAASRTEQIMNLFNEQRLFNLNLNVHGALLVNSEVVLSIFEGADEAVAQAFYQFNKLHALADFSHILNLKTDNGICNSWQLKFYRSESESCQNFVERLQTMIDQEGRFENVNAKELWLKLIDSVESVNDELDKPLNSQNDFDPTVPMFPPFEASMLALRAWPKPSQIKLTPSIMKACATLVKKPMSYPDLLNMGIWQSADDLQSFLKTTHQLGLLKTSSVTVSTSRPQPVRKVSSESRFSKLLKKLISTPVASVK